MRDLVNPALPPNPDPLTYFRVVDTGDLHVTEGPRLEAQLAVLDWMIADATSSGRVDLWMLGGDLTGVTVPHIATMLERLGLAIRIRRMAEHAPVIIVYGNHDYHRDLELYALVNGDGHKIDVLAQPGIVSYRVRNQELDVLALPYTWPKLGIETVGDRIQWSNDEVHENIALALRCRETRTAPMICLYHGTVTDAAIAGGETMRRGQEVEIPAATLDRFDYAGCHHIHLRQQMGERTWYSGSPDRSNYGEEEDVKGYLVVDVARDRPPIVHSRISPARRMRTIKGEYRDGVFLVDGTPIDLAADTVPEAVRGLDVRLRISVPDTERATCPADAMKAALEALGAATVDVQVRTLPTTRVRSEAIQAATTLEEKCAAYWDSLTTEGPDAAARARMLALLPELEAAL